MIPIAIKVSRAKVKGQAYFLYAGEGGISVLQTSIFHTILVHDSRGIMTFTQGHISKVKVRVYTYLKSVSGQLLLIALLDLDNISHNCCP